MASKFDLDIDARRQLEAHQRVHRLRGRVQDVDQALVRPDLELLRRVLIDVWGADHAPRNASARRPVPSPLARLAGDLSAVEVGSSPATGLKGRQGGTE